MDEYRIIVMRGANLFLRQSKGGECVEGPTLYSANDLRAKLNEQPEISALLSRNRCRNLRARYWPYPSALVLAQ